MEREEVLILVADFGAIFVGILIGCKLSPPTALLIGACTLVGAVIYTKKHNVEEASTFAATAVTAILDIGLSTIAMVTLRWSGLVRLA